MIDYRDVYVLSIILFGLCGFIIQFFNKKIHDECIGKEMFDRLFSGCEGGFTGIIFGIGSPVFIPGLILTWIARRLR